MVKKHKVIFLPYNKEIIVEDGANLLQAALEAGAHINASCGGEGVCGLLKRGRWKEGILLSLAKKTFGLLPETDFLPCTDLNLFPRLKARLDARSALQKRP